MKKLTIFLIAFVIFISLFNVQALGDDKNEKLKLENEKQVESLYKYISNIKGKYEILQDIEPQQYVMNFLKSGDGKFSFKKLNKYILSYSFKGVLASFKIMISIIVIGIISALLTNLQNAFSNESMLNIAYFTCYALIIILVAKSFKIGVNLVSSAIKEMSNFMLAIMPILLVFLANVGGFVEVTALDPIIIAIINICARMYITFIIPLILISFVLNFVNNISKQHKIDNLSKLFKNVALWTQGIVMTLFVAIVNIRGLTCKTIDAVTIKTAKYAIDNFVPVVGKCLSDAISSVVGYSLLMKNALSSLGLVILIGIVLFPIIKTFLIGFMYKISAALIEPICDKGLVDCINNCGDSIFVLMSTLISVSVMFFIMICIVASSGMGIIGG